MDNHNNRKQTKIQQLITEINNLNENIQHFYAVHDPLYRDYEKAKIKAIKEMNKLIGAK